MATTATETAPAAAPPEETPAAAAPEETPAAALPETADTAAAASTEALDVEKAEETTADVPTANKLSDEHFFAIADIVLRFLLFSASLVVVVLLATGKQTKGVPTPAKFEHSPSLIYVVAAFSVAGLYSIITYLLSLYAILIKPGFCPEILSQFIIFDVILLGIVAVATGAIGTIGYLSLKGDSHVGWKKVCSVYDIFCKHVSASAGVSVFASAVVAVLVLFSIFALLKKVPK
ncbi:CASP-like protein 1 [Andrographis paniculata]|uniref:CASP-like protein 1 n=1 Tax=Andrographis paniculata TaxID=175694 RepID=UPI0021E6FF47|nr:CASP-like protein 1 [Andrographis paniculata]